MRPQTRQLRLHAVRSGLALLESEDGQEHQEGPLHRAGVDKDRAESDLAALLKSPTEKLTD